MKYWGWIKNKLITLKKKIASYTEKGKQSGLKIKDFCCSFIHKIYVRYRNYENRKELTGAIIVWFLAFFFVIGICKIYKSSSVSAKANEEEQSVLPLQTVPHEKLKVAKIENATTPVATSAEETSQQVETQTPVEKETVDVSKLNVSKQLLADDVENMNNKEVVNAADVKTKPSGNYDSSQFVYGIDISYHQGKIDWAKVKQSGVDYAFIRVGNRGYETGKLCKDARFDENVQGALANGIKVGVYFFSQATNEEESLEEASLTLSYIRNYNISLPVVIDWETDKGYRTNCGLSKTQLTGILSKFCDTVSGYGYEPMVYMCKDDFFSRIHTQSITSKYKTWVAWYFQKYNSNNYANNVFKYNDALPDMTFDYSVWQYSRKGRINGIKELTDMNIMIVPKKVVTYDLKLNVTNTNLCTNIGNDINLLNGVTASGSLGNDTTSQIRVSIKNVNGNEVSKDNVIRTSGKYTITYSYTESDGKSISKQAVLFVRDLPTIYYMGQIWNDNLSRDINYTYDYNLSETDNFNKINNLIHSTIKSYYYKTIAGDSNPQTPGYIEVQGVQEAVNEKDVIGTKAYSINYMVNDGMGLTNKKILNLVITRTKQEKDTSQNNVTN